METMLVEPRGDLPQRPDVVGHPSRHRGRPRVEVLQALVRAGEVVGLEVQGDGRSVVLDLPAERVGQSGEPPYVHPHREVRPLDVAVLTWSGSGSPMMTLRSTPMHFAGEYR